MSVGNLIARLRSGEHRELSTKLMMTLVEHANCNVNGRGAIFLPRELLGRSGGVEKIEIELSGRVGSARDLHEVRFECIIVAGYGDGVRATVNDATEFDLYENDGRLMVAYTSLPNARFDRSIEAPSRL